MPVFTLLLFFKTEEYTTDPRVGGFGERMLDAALYSEFMLRTAFDARAQCDSRMQQLLQTLPPARVVDPFTILWSDFASAAE
eukprot:12840-Heterococcus_DN1.PRE.1